MKNISTGTANSHCARRLLVVPNLNLARMQRTVICVLTATTCLTANGEGIIAVGVPGDLVRSVSASGAVVIGDGPSGAWRWTASGGRESLPLPESSTVSAASDDGLVIAGTTGDGRAFRWSVEQGISLVGPAGSGASGISGDGAVVVGSVNGRPFRWDAVAGIQELPVFPTELYAGGGQALDCSYDGSIIVGSSRTNPGGSQAVRWTSGGLIPLPMYDYFSQANAVSGDGTTVVGYGCAPCGALRWRASSFQSSPLNWGGQTSVATGVSADGSLVVGGFDGGHSNWDGAIMWSRIAGSVMLREHLTARGVDVSNWSRLGGIGAVSANGRVVAGVGIQNNQSRAFLADIGEFAPSIPTCVAADIYRDHNVNGADLGILLFQWGPVTSLTQSDFNADDVVDGADLGVLLNWWGPCP
jgi:uncharacterized membrane protein